LRDGCINGGDATHCTSIDAANAFELQDKLDKIGPGKKQSSTSLTAAEDKDSDTSSYVTNIKDLLHKSSFSRNRLQDKIKLRRKRLRDGCVNGGDATHCTSIDAANAFELQDLLDKFGPGKKRSSTSLTAAEDKEGNTQGYLNDFKEHVRRSSFSRNKLQDKIRLLRKSWRLRNDVWN